MEYQHVSGFAELSRALKELPDQIARNVLRGAAGAAAAVIRDEAKTRAPVYTGDVAAGHPPPGTLKKQIYQKQIAEFSDFTRQVYFVGVRQGKKYQAVKKTKKAKGVKTSTTVNFDAYYWRFVELGTSRMAARPFLRPAFESRKMAAVDRMREYLAERIPREVQKLPGASK